jgi:catechol 2,3-dioxygenase
LHAAKSRVPFTGASDHDVSEAIYLDNPEGNGVEVYSDRPREKWRRDGKLILQKTEPLDIDAIIREIDPATATYPSAPEGLRIGHIHLRVGNVASAEAFYCGALGLDVTRRRTGATFLSSGGYHHHMAVNVWHSNGAGIRRGKRAGLVWFAMEINDQPTIDGVKKRLDAAGMTIDSIPGGFATTDRHLCPFHHCALNARARYAHDGNRRANLRQLPDSAGGARPLRARSEQVPTLHRHNETR